MERFTAGTTVLDREQATELLRRKDVGRIVIALGGDAEIFPVNYVLSEAGNVLFRTGPGSKLASAVVAQEVAFEVDEVGGDQAWSVIVRGPARVRTDSSALSVTDALSLRPFIDDGKYEVVEVLAERVTARGFGRTWS
ncbi:pyridoxamine 5'-phosphate oxidase family protein [Tsukamurella spumae]|uniref:Pyridoxamine 5'-phosphate oxidase family protein n=1 Tax=Tsukamurella spumae TaxID=44753 RepID=A0A846WZM8_9ACTN|nr:pyridoxamine 5'-phosphate oxidase family protein [Tsukamurella spumae]NKY17190.1 pyridoxamine 5'-phosphate oxidase family protein [Tsukamurella spumae]